MESIRVLVVEDDQDINNLLCTILRDGGYESQAAFSGSEGLLWAERENFDLVLLDLMLPGLTGEQFIQKIRPLRTMPIIVLSAKAGLEDKVNVLRMGADDFIPKPFGGTGPGGGPAAAGEEVLRAPRPEAAALLRGLGAGPGRIYRHRRGKARYPHRPGV